MDRERLRVINLGAVDEFRRLQLQERYITFFQEHSASVTFYTDRSHHPPITRVFAQINGHVAKGDTIEEVYNQLKEIQDEKKNRGRPQQNESAGVCKT